MAYTTVFAMKIPQVAQIFRLRHLPPSVNIRRITLPVSESEGASVCIWEKDSQARVLAQYIDSLASADWDSVRQRRSQ